MKNPLDQLNLTPREAYFALSRIISWADGVQQEAELDALATLRMVEQIDLDVYDKIETISDDTGLFSCSIAALKDHEAPIRARACAWMLMTAMVANEGPVTTRPIKWDLTLANVSPEERDWINRAQKALDVADSALDDAFDLIPRIRSMD